MMNKPGKKNKGQPESQESIGQITSLPDFYEDFCPEEINEIFFTESAQRDRSIHHQIYCSSRGAEIVDLGYIWRIAT